ncbi:MAG: GGDEF domain-containing protein [Lachnospiraceae bacterium]|nr:GGDEF domain-containing protein [Lachnospiraceae bacterium]
MDANNIRKLTLSINTFILLLVFGLMYFFHVCNATILVYFSIPTIFVYLFGYIIILRRQLYFYVRLVYCWLTLYMSLTTVCLGHNYGFCLYCLSMIPIVYYSNYIAYRLGLKQMKTSIFSAAIIACYLSSTGYAAINGPIYQGPKGAAGFFWFINSLIVFTFLIVYTRILIKTTIRSEEGMKRMSYIDNLTGLYNRHYMMEQLSDIGSINESAAVIMIDIDDFKKINDVYGHNAGDYVLKTLADIMRSSCGDKIISRWGGEEFLLLDKNTGQIREHMEDLRKQVESYDFVFEDKKIEVTITAGLAERSDHISVDKWIQRADENLYYGKNNGKNTVIG